MERIDEHFVKRQGAADAARIVAELRDWAAERRQEAATTEKEWVRPDDTHPTDRAVAENEIAMLQRAARVIEGVADTLALLWGVK